jgi:hypothetical protein
MDCTIAGSDTKICSPTERFASQGSFWVEVNLCRFLLFVYIRESLGSH